MATAKRTFVPIENALDMQLELFFGDLRKTYLRDCDAMLTFCLCFRRKTGMRFFCPDDLLEYLDVEKRVVQYCNRLGPFWRSEVALWKSVCRYYDYLTFKFKKPSIMMNISPEYDNVLLQRYDSSEFDGALIEEAVYHLTQGRSTEGRSTEGRSTEGCSTEGRSTEDNVPPKLTPDVLSIASEVHAKALELSVPVNVLIDFLEMRKRREDSYKMGFRMGGCHKANDLMYVCGRFHMSLNVCMKHGVNFGTSFWRDGQMCFVPSTASAFDASVAASNLAFEGNFQDGVLTSSSTSKRVKCVFCLKSSSRPCKRMMLKPFC